MASAASRVLLGRVSAKQALVGSSSAPYFHPGHQIVLGPMPLLGRKRASCRVPDGIWGPVPSPHLSQELWDWGPAAGTAQQGSQAADPGCARSRFQNTGNENTSRRPMACLEVSPCPAGAAFPPFLVREARWVLAWLLAHT